MVFENIGMKVKINHLESTRSIENVDVGLDDAEYARIKGLSNRYHNLRMVDDKLIPDIEQSLRAMKARGEYRNIVDLFNK